MKNYLQTNHLINISDVDVNYNLRLDNMLNCFQDITTFHSFELGVDRESLVKNCSAFWVLSKIKVVFNKLPMWNEDATIKTWPTTVSPIRFFREFSITTPSGAKVDANSEWCVLDANTFAIRRSSSINYPFDMEHIAPNPESVKKIKHQVRFFKNFSLQNM